MDDLRRDVKEAFEKDEANLGDLTGARERIIRSALAARPDEMASHMQLAASVAAILVAAVVIATFVYVRSGTQPTHGGPIPTPTPLPSASPTPLSNRLDVPADTPVILYHDPANFDQIDGTTWGGDKSGAVGQGVEAGGSPNPAGTFYGTSTDIRDRTGKVVAALDTGAVKGFNGFWADDELHYCEMVRSAARDVTAPAILQLAAPGQRAKSIARLGVMPSANLNGGGPAVVACSPGNDRAVVAQSGGQGVGVRQFWVVQLSTGHIVWSGGSGSGITASHDGKYVALTQQSQTTQSTTVYGPSGSVQAHVDGQLYLFSWDGALAVAQKRDAPVTVIRWRDASIVWSGPRPGAYYYSQSSAEPGGARLAIGIINALNEQNNGFPLVDLYVVDPDGKVVFERKSISLI